MNISKEIEELDSCVICYGKSNSRDAKFEKMLGLVSPYKVQVCRECSLRWLSPRPSQEAYVQLYENENYLSSVETYSTLAAERSPYFRERVKKIESHFESDIHLKILDFGAATGEFSNEAINRGHNLTGIEPSVDARATAKKVYDIDLVNIGLSDIEDETFDVIHMNHVFEHLGDPNVILKDCHRLLKNEGMLVLEIPQQFYNDLDRLKLLIGMRSDAEFSVYSLHHTFFYTPSSIKSILVNNGFELIYLSTANPNRTPLWPFSLKNIFLRIFLWASERIHRGGNIIEVYVKKN